MKKAATFLLLRVLSISLYGHSNTSNVEHKLPMDKLFRIINSDTL
jgi:hypothetical protein